MLHFCQLLLSNGAFIYIHYSMFSTLAVKYMRMKISNKQYFIIKLLNSSLRPQSDISGLILSESLCWSHLTEDLFNVFFFFYRSPISTIQILMPFLWPSTKVTVDKKRALNCCSRVTSTNPFQLRRGQCWLFTIYTESCESVRKFTFFFLRAHKSHPN